MALLRAAVSSCLAIWRRRSTDLEGYRPDG